MRAVQCPRCGAPAPAELGARESICGFCGARLVMDPPAPTRPAAPPGHAQPHTPTSAKAGLAAAAILVVLVLGGSSLAFVLARSGPTGALGTTGNAGISAATLVAMPLDESAAAVAQRFGTTVREKHVSSTLDDGPIKHVSATWDEPDHVTTINLGFRDEAAGARLAKALEQQLGRGFKPMSSDGRSLSGQGVTLTVSSSLTLNAHERDDPRWKLRFATLWRATLHATFGAGSPLDAATRRNVLNLDASLADLKQVDLRVPFERSAGETTRVFPAANARGSSQGVGLGHPLFENVNVTWENAQGGAVTSVNFYFWTDGGVKDGHARVRGCLEPKLGQPTRRDTDFAAGKYSLDWPAKGAVPRVHATEQLVMLFRAAGTQPAGWHAVIDALTPCA